MKRILDPKFKYVPAVETDLKKTFARIRAEQRKNAEEAQAKVSPLKKVAHAR